MVATVGFAMQMIYVAVTVVVVAFYLLIWLSRRLRGSKSKIRPPSIAFILPGVTAMMVATFFITQSSWLPYEVVSVRNSDDVTGQVFGSDGTWTTFLDKNQDIQIVRTADVVSRQPCYTDTSIWANTLGGLVLARERQSDRMPCPR